MSRSIFTWPIVLSDIAVITEQEESRYSDIPGCEGLCEGFTAAAILLVLMINDRRQDVWFPFSQLRKAKDGQSVYASDWILAQKNL